MSDNSAKILKQLVSKQRMQDIDQWIAKYPKDQRQSAVMSTLRSIAGARLLLPFKQAMLKCVLEVFYLLDLLV